LYPTEIVSTFSTSTLPMILNPTEPHSHLQNKFLHAYYATRATQLTSQLRGLTLVHRNMVSTSASSTFLTTPLHPSIVWCYFSPEEFRLLCYLRIGYKIFNSGGVCVACNGGMDIY